MQPSTFDVLNGSGMEFAIDLVNHADLNTNSDMDREFPSEVESFEDVSSKEMSIDGMESDSTESDASWTEIYSVRIL